MSKSLKIFFFLCIIVSLLTIFMIVSEMSFTRAFKRDFFPNDIASNIEYSKVLREKNVAWALVGNSKDQCKQLITVSDWGEGLSWQKSPSSEESHEDKLFDKLFDQYHVKDTDIEAIYSKIVDGADVAYLILLSEPIDGKYFCIICVFRT